MVYLLCITDADSPELSIVTSSPAAAAEDESLRAFDSDQVYDSSAAQLITVISAASSSSNQPI